MKTVRILGIAVVFAASWLVGCMTTKASLSSKHPIVNSIFVSGTTVYTAGFHAQGPAAVACYWTNGSRTDLPGQDGVARSVFVVGSDVYVAGFVK